ncbi:MAG: helix-turn-helix transcriptional regulator [Deltaproteobacteria bacterium]|nr:helix-turn-helix transcriptional regulator [Deltaproteobacteria bacterium]
MSKRVNEKLIGFGARLAQLRKAAGYTQVELAAEIGVSQRNIAYYEGQTQHPPTAILPELARALGVTADDLLGVTPIKRAARPANTRLLRRLQQIEKLDTREKRQILSFLDTFIEREQLRKKAGNR